MSPDIFMGHTGYDVQRPADYLNHDFMRKFQ